MLKSSRFIDERLSVSITSLNPPIAPVDANEPLNFKQWLSYNNSLFTNSDEFLARYQSYLNNWYEVKNYQEDLRKITTKSLYTTLINEIVLTYSTSDEKRFLKNLDFNNNRDLAVAVPFFAQKIKEICLYYSTLRDDVKTAVVRYNLKGSNYGVQKLVYNEISKSLETEDLTELIKNINLSLSSVRNNMVVDVEDLYDTYTNYLDTSYNLPASSYDAESDIRKKYFNLNQYDIDPYLFLDFNTSVVQAITSYPFFLIELGDNNFSITPNVNSTNLQFLKDSDFINTINNRSISNLNLNLQKDLIQKYSGTDFYYIYTTTPLTTGSTFTEYLTGVLFTANAEFANYLNKRYPSVAAIPSVDFLKTAKDVGLFFKPDKIGLANFNNFGLTVTVNRSALSANTVYIFPDPKKYENVSGLTEEEFSSPLTFLENNYYNKIDFSNQFKFGDSESDPFFQIYRAYQSREQTLDTSTQGLEKYTDPQDFFKGSLKSLWANEDIFPKIPSNEFPIDKRIQSLYSLNKTLVQYKNDIYGNEYSLYKDVYPQKSGSSTKNEDGINFYLCLELDGHTFFDAVSGYNFDYTTVDDELGYSGIVLKTTTNIPPGTGYYVQGPSYLLPSPLSASLYNNGMPQFSLSGSSSPIVSYKFLPDVFCPSKIELSFLCSVYDGVTFLTQDQLPLPDFPSDDPAYNPSNPNLYYNILIDAGVNKFAPNYRANFSYAGQFTFNPPISAITSFNGTYFLVNSSEPCGSELEFVISYDEKSTYLNYHIPQRDTKLMEGLSGLEFKRTIYQTKYLDSGDAYFRNIDSTVITPLSTALSGIYTKYNQSIQEELVNNLIGLDVYYDTIQFETDNFIVFDKIQFDADTSKVYNISENDTYFERGIYKNFEKLSTVWFDENENLAFFARTVLFNELSSTNYKIIYPEIFVLNIDDLTYNRIYPTTNKNDLSFTILREFSLSGNDINVNIVEIDKPLFSYNDDTGTYSITYLGRDISNVFYIIKVLFKYVNGVITNISNKMFKLAPNVNTINFSLTKPTDFSLYNILGTTVGTVSGGSFVYGEE